MSVQSAANQVTPPIGLKQQLRLDEGFSKFPYRCTKNKLSIGYGFNIEDNGIPLDVAEFWLDWNIKQCELELVKNFPAYRALDPIRQQVLLNMNYNLGIDRFMRFRKMLAYVSEHKFSDAAAEILDSDAARSETSVRYHRLAHQMEYGI